MAGKKRSISVGPDVCEGKKEWEEVVCPVCLEHPHNAVLLVCCSHAKGCRSYICDTSYRHSNCFDRFKKLHFDSTNTSSPTQSPTQNNIGRQNFTSLRGESELAAKLGLKCPLCREDVLGWKVIEDARNHLNLKPRNCTRESCSFVGNYSELRRHARSVHPRVRPAEVDPTRERAWRLLEHRWERDDIVSAIHSAMPGAVVMGDYVLETSDGSPDEREHTPGDVDGPLWVLLEMLESRSRPRSWTRNHRPRRQRFHWGANLLGLHDDDDDDSFSDEDDVDMFSDIVSRDVSPVRRRRRLNHSRSSRDRL